MARFDEVRAGVPGRWLVALAVAPLLALATGLVADAGEAADSSSGRAALKKNPAPKGPDAAAAPKAKKARPKVEEKQEAPPSLAELGRPSKTVTPPALTSAELDMLVDRFLGSTQAPPAAPTSDVEFVRRIYLDLAGKLPTPEQTRAFVSTREKDKRAKLIDYLLNGREYAVNWARFWRDVVRYRATNQNGNRVGYDELEEWLADQIARNRPWDEVAHDLITASGRTDENGAVGFTLAHEAQPVEVAGEVSRIFLGVQIQCAQCHDHPSDSWKRQQFHEFAAFFAGSKSRRANAQGQNPPVFEVVMPGKPRYTMPDLKDPQVQVGVAPKFFLASAKGNSNKTGGMSTVARHELAASYVTGQDNPWFAKAFVNRVWGALMGDAFYMPVDDIGPERTAKAPEIIEALASQWQQGGYDVRWLFRTVLNTRAYQREVRSTYSASGRTPFAANCPSRLRSDQIYDALTQVLNLNATPAKGPNGAQAKGKAVRKASLAKDLKDVPRAKGPRGGGNDPRDKFDAVFGVDPSTPGDDIVGTIPQALFLMNASQVNQALEARPGTVLGQILMNAHDDKAAVDAIYLRAFARKPTAKEVATLGRYIEAVGDRKEAYEDIFWSLINSTEFVTRR